jgi:hypothetical protein
MALTQSEDTVARRLYDLLDTLVAMRMDFETNVEGRAATRTLGPEKITEIQALLDRAIGSTKDIIGTIGPVRISVYEPLVEIRDQQVRRARQDLRGRRVRRAAPERRELRACRGGNTSRQRASMLHLEFSAGPSQNVQRERSRWAEDSWSMDPARGPFSSPTFA